VGKERKELAIGWTGLPKEHIGFKMQTALKREIPANTSIETFPMVTHQPVPVKRVGHGSWRRLVLEEPVVRRIKEKDTVVGWRPSVEEIRMMMRKK